MAISDLQNEVSFGRQRSPHLLVVDDMAIHRMIISKMAKKAGFLTHEAASCADVRVLPAINAFDCVTLDLSLGERGGNEVLCYLAELRFCAPIIIISGSDENTANEAFSLGVSLGLQMLAPIDKPVDLAALREILLGVTKKRAEATA